MHRNPGGLTAFKMNLTLNLKKCILGFLRGPFGYFGVLLVSYLIKKTNFLNSFYPEKFLHIRVVWYLDIVAISLTPYGANGLASLAITDPIIDSVAFLLPSQAAVLGCHATTLVCHPADVAGSLDRGGLHDGHSWHNRPFGGHLRKAVTAHTRSRCLSTIPTVARSRGLKAVTPGTRIGNTWIIERVKSAPSSIVLSIGF